MCDMDVNSRFKVKNCQHLNVNGVDVVVRRNGVHKCCPQQIWESNKTCLTALAAKLLSINSHHPTDTAELSSGFNSIGFGASHQAKTIKLSWTSSVLHLETTSGMFKIFQSFPECMYFGTSYLTHLTRLEEQMKTLPYPPYIGKTSLQLRSMGWNLANLSVTAPIGPLPL